VGDGTSSLETARQHTAFALVRIEETPMRNTVIATAAAAGLLAGCGIGAPAYPTFGQSSYRMEGATASASGGSPVHTVIYRDGPKMRVETVLPTRGQAIIVFDESTNAAYVLNPTGQAPVTVAPGTTAPAAAAPSAAPSASATPATAPATAPVTATAPAPAPAAGVAAPAAAPQVIGVAVRIEDSDAPQPLETAWQALGKDNARSVGNCEVANERGHEWRPREAPAPGVERTACITDDGIVLRVRENSRVLWQATSLQRGQQDAALFGVPPGYQLIDPQHVADEVGQNMQQLDSVTGAPPQQQQAPPARQPG
jgi:hypothetical protein